MKRVLWNTLYVLLVSGLASAQVPAATRPSRSTPPVIPSGATTCNQAAILPEDGTSGGYSTSIPAGSTNYYIQVFLTGHSYSVDVWDPFDANLFHFPFFLGVFDYQTCSTAISYQNTGGTAPYLYDNANRVSWIQSLTGQQAIKVQNFDTLNSYSYYIRIIDTTLYNPRWSTYSGYTTQYSFVNVSANSSPIVGTLTVYDNTSTSITPVVLATATITVPSGGQYLYTVMPPTVPANHFGFSTFAFVGPPGVIRADAYFINSSATVVVPSTFGPISEPH